MTIQYRAGNRCAFTLIEVLVVISIIAILIAIVIPTVRSVFLRQQKTTAAADTKRIATAWKLYWSEYNRWPSRAQEANATGQVMDSTFVAMLTTRFAAAEPENPRRLKFIELTADQLDSRTNVVDPFIVEGSSNGLPYRVLFDTDFDGKCERPGFPDVYDTVIAWSAGPDNKDGTVADAADNVNSWQ